MTLAQLLIVQEHDSAIDRLVHARANLPEFAALAMIDDEQSHLEGERRSIADKRHEIARDQKRFEDEAAMISERIDKENALLYSGSITAHKELQAIQHELETLTKRRNEIEDHVLEAMELGEPLDVNLAALDEKLASLDVRRTAATESLAASQAEIDREIEAERAARVAAAAEVDTGLLAEYESTRAALGGVGVSRLVDKTCEGCHLQLSAVAIDRIRKEPADALVRCTECSRILVR